MSVRVKNTDYNSESEYVIGTSVLAGVNGSSQVHGRCSPADGATVDAQDGFFLCARDVPLPFSADRSYMFVTSATDAVNEAFRDRELFMPLHSPKCLLACDM